LKIWKYKNVCKDTTKPKKRRFQSKEKRQRKFIF
jgi:hypothetical protein